MHPVRDHCQDPFQLHQSAGKKAVPRDGLPVFLHCNMHPFPVKKQGGVLRDPLALPDRPSPDRQGLQHRKGEHREDKNSASPQRRLRPPAHKEHQKSRREDHIDDPRPVAVDVPHIKKPVIPGRVPVRILKSHSSFLLQGPLPACDPSESQTARPEAIRPGRADITIIPHSSVSVNCPWDRTNRSQRSPPV